MLLKATEDIETRLCLGCGYCCLQAPCSTAMRVYGNAIELCPALKWDNEAQRHWCKLAQIDTSLGFAYRKELHIGAGCCSGLNSWRREPIQDRITALRDKPKHDPYPAIDDQLQAFLTALGKQLGLSGDMIWLACNQFKRELIVMGYKKEVADELEKLARHYISNNRHSYTEQFMG